MFEPLQQIVVVKINHAVIQTFISRNDAPIPFLSTQPFDHSDGRGEQQVRSHNQGVLHAHADVWNLGLCHDCNDDLDS